MDLQQHNREECEEITPKQNYKYFEIDALNQNAEHHVIRAANTKNESEVFKGGIFLINAFLREPNKYGEAAGLSLNLLGGHFTKAHLKYVQKGIAASYWNEGELIILDNLSEFISVDDSRVPIYFPLRKLHNLNFPFEKNIDSSQLKRIPRDLTVETKERGIYRVEAILRIKHAPTNANFWHVEFELIDNTKDSENKVVSSIKSYKSDKEFKAQHSSTKLVHSLLNKIKFVARKEPREDLSAIPSSLYTR